MDDNINDTINQLQWDKMPLIPTITQDSTSKEVLMLAYSSQESLRLTLESGFAHYFSRSKQRIWQKGEESGNTQEIVEIHIDCDNDTLLFVVRQIGQACHTGHKSCFYRQIYNETTRQDLPKLQAKKEIPYNVLDKLYHTLQGKKGADIATSYTALMYSKGENTIGKKIAEEAAEFAFALKDNNEGEIIYECADLLYHSLLALSYRDISPDRVMQELQRRFGISGIEEKKNRNKG